MHDCSGMKSYHYLYANSLAASEGLLVSRIINCEALSLDITHGVQPDLHKAYLINGMNFKVGRA